MEINITGDRIRIARAIHKPPLNQLDLLARLQVRGLRLTQSALSKMENGQRAVTDMELVALADALDVSVLWLLGQENTTV